MFKLPLISLTGYQRRTLFHGTPWSLLLCRTILTWKACCSFIRCKNQVLLLIQ
uniref:Uncharacterized protein n=1 Tax=Arundo donax TaxID=35708 RepID=A0A0A9FUY3_ARUDO